MRKGTTGADMSAGTSGLGLPSSAQTGSTRHSGIEVGRLVACFAVILLHQEASDYGSYGFVSDLFDQAARWAVPFFFIISGYFMPLTGQWFSVSARYFRRLFPVFVFWCLFYLAISDDPAIHLESLRSLSKLLVGGPGFHLWFLPSLGICLSIAAAFIYAGAIRGLIILSAFLYLIGLALGSYSAAVLDLLSIDRQIDVNSRNGPFFGLIFVTIGHLIRIGTIRPTLWSGIAVLGLGALITAAEALLFYVAYGTGMTRHDFLLGTLPFGLGAALVFLSWDIRSPSASAAARLVGAYSLGIYAVHLAVLRQVTAQLQPASPGGGILVAVLTLFVSTVIAVTCGQIPALKRAFR